MSDHWFAVGHRTISEHRTGCTAITFDQPVPAAVDIRGGAPGTRETPLLDPARPSFIDGLVLSGGSAFGLRTADGTMDFLAEQGRGYPAPAGPVPRVPAAIIYDLEAGSGQTLTAYDGYEAARSAIPNNREMGLVGAGTGATVAKLGGQPGSRGGLGVADIDGDFGPVTALVVVNAVGDIVDPAIGDYLAKTVDPTRQGRSGRDLATGGALGQASNLNTTIGAILVSHPLDSYGLARCCIAAHDALARCVVPSHTILDGDTFFTVAPATGSVAARELLGLCSCVEVAVERAITGIFSKTAVTDEPDED